MTIPTNSKIVIAVMGVTGAGKSYLIRQITGNSKIEVGHSLYSCTGKVTPYTFQHDGVDITLVDTPGFSDTYRRDVEVLKDISTWAAESYGTGQLSAIIYLHRITDIRMDGASIRSIRLLKSLVGEGNMKNVLLTTTQWSSVTQEEGERREKELRETESFWKGLLGHGATLTRFEGDRQSGLELLRKVTPSDLKVLDIQSEIIEEEKTLAETTAGKTVNEDLDRIREKYEREIREMRDELQAALAAQDKKMKEILEQERKDTAAKVEKLREAQEELAKVGRLAKGLLYINELDQLRFREGLLIYVKGTLEMGNVGLSGSLLSLRLGGKLRSRLAIQGVDYDPTSSLLSFFTGGSRRATQGVVDAVRGGIECGPKKKIFVCGYGQGAMIICRALAKLNDLERARITGLIFFSQERPWGAIGKVPRGLHDRCLDIALPKDYLVLSEVLFGIKYRSCQLAFPATIKFIEEKMGEY